MKFQLVLIVSVGIALNVSATERTIDNMENRSNLLDNKKHTYKVPPIEQRDALSRKMRSASLIPQNDLVGNKIDLKDVLTMLSNTIGDIDHQKNIEKRHACRHRENRWKHFRLDHNDNNNYEKVQKSKDSSEESKEVNTEDPFYVESAENISTKEEEKIRNESQNASNDKRRKNNSNHERRNKHNELKNVKRNESNEDENEKLKESGESADKEEFIFPNVSQKKENKNRKDDNNRRNQRVERDVIEEENVATTASGFKFTSGYADFGSKVSFRNINV